MTLHGGIWLVSRGGKLEGFFIVVKGISYFRGGITAGKSRLAERKIEFCPNK